MGRANHKGQGLVIAGEGINDHNAPHPAIPQSPFQLPSGMDLATISYGKGIDDRTKITLDTVPIWHVGSWLEHRIRRDMRREPSATDQSLKGERGSNDSLHNRVETEARGIGQCGSNLRARHACKIQR